MTEPLRWTDQAYLRRSPAGTGRDLVRPLARGSVLELVHQLLHTPEMNDLQLCDGHGGSVLHGTELRRLFRASQVARLFPMEGCEAHAALAGDRVTQPIAAPFFRGHFPAACRSVWQLPPEQRVHAFIVTHDEIFSPDRLEAMRPS